MFKYIALIVAFMWLFASSASADVELVWGLTFEAAPGNSDLFSEGPLRIRDTKENIRKRLEVEHSFGPDTTNASDNGLHHIGSARCFVQNSEPTVIAMPDFNPAGAGQDGISDTATGETDERVGFGRCWIDRDGADDIIGTSDDHSLYIYDQDPDDDADFMDEVWILVGTGANAKFYTGGNLLSCGSFDCMDSSDATIPDQGRWVDSTFGSTISYLSTQTSEGLGQVINVSTTQNGDAIGYTLNGLKVSTTYFVSGRVRKVSGDGSCGILTNNMTTGSGVDMPEETTTSSSFVSLRGTFTTGTSLAASPTTGIEVNVTSGTVVCQWDHLGVFQVTTQSGHVAIDNPGNLVRYVSSNTQTAISDNTGGSTDGWQDSDFFDEDITVPNDGYYVKVTASLCVGVVSTVAGTTTMAAIGARIKRDPDGAGAVEVVRGFVGSEPVGANGTTTLDQLTIQYVDMEPVPGVVYSYTVQPIAECHSVTACSAGTIEPAINPSTEVNPSFGANTNYTDVDDGCAGGNGSSYMLIEAIRAY